MTHTLKGNNAREVWLDGKKLSPARSQKVFTHSPKGFGWGHGGAGSAQLALAIILELTGKLDGYQNFKWDVIALIPQGTFEISFKYGSEKDGTNTTTKV